MKQIWMIVVVGLFMIGFSSLAFTQEHKGGMIDTSKDMKQGNKMCPGKMHGMGHGCPMMMGKSLVATASGIQNQSKLLDSRLRGSNRLGINRGTL